jgi:hypothetical protein
VEAEDAPLLNDRTVFLLVHSSVVTAIVLEQPRGQGHSGRLPPRTGVGPEGMDAHSGAQLLLPPLRDPSLKPFRVSCVRERIRRLIRTLKLMVSKLCSNGMGNKIGKPMQ